jgi:hypothetical protein
VKEVRERLDEAEERCRREREERVRLEDVIAELMTKIKAMESKTDQRENTPHIVPQENHHYQSSSSSSSGSECEETNQDASRSRIKEEIADIDKEIEDL